MKGKIFINGRGGCGKSTFISLIAKELSKDNKVLIIDMDEGNLGLNKMLNVDVADTSLMEYYGGRDKIMGEILKVGIKGMVLEKINLKDDAASEMFNHLESLNADYSSIETLDKIINTIFDSNNENVHVEILLIDYGDKITINMKDEGDREVMKGIEKSFSQDNIKVSEVMGFNNIEYVIEAN